MDATESVNTTECVSTTESINTTEHVNNTEDANNTERVSNTDRCNWYGAWNIEWLRSYIGDVLHSLELYSVTSKQSGANKKGGTYVSC